MAKYIKNAFAVNGDRQPVPDDTQPSGQVSYQSGYTPDYGLPKTDPNRKSIGRQPWNQLFNDVTANIKEWQDYGYPEFVSDDGTGSQLSYGYGRVVHLSGVLYRALVDNTSTTPPSAEWELYDPANDVNALLSYAVSQLANGDLSKVGLLIDGTVVDALDYVVYPPELTIWATNDATGTSDGTLNTGTGAAGGVTGALTLTQYDKYDNTGSGLTATTQQSAIDELGKYRQEITIDFPANADFALSADQNLYGRITLTDIADPLTAPRVVTVSDTEREINVTNNTAQDITVKTAAGTGALVSSGSYNVILVDGTNAVRSPNAPVGVGQLPQAAELTDTGATFLDGSPAYRTAGVVYTNDTGSTITVSIWGRGTSAGNPFSVEVDGVLWASPLTGSNNDAGVSVTFPVPPGSDWEMTNAGSNNVSGITEMRNNS